MASILVKVGMAIVILGVLIEMIGMLAVGYYPVRRRLAIFPVSIIAIGGYCFFGGVLLILAARLLLQ